MQKPRLVSWQKTAPLWGFAVMAGVPMALAVAGAQGVSWAIAGALIWVGFASQMMDTLAPRTFADPEQSPTGLTVAIGLGGGHFAVLIAVLYAFSQPALGMWGRIGLFLSAGLIFGQISNSVAHELIHARQRGTFRLGAGIYLSLLFGHHTSAHRLVHHVHVATDQDPNSARLGEGFWRFAPRAWIGSFRKGYQAEASLCARKPGRINPYWIWCGGAVVLVMGVFLWGGWRVVLDYLALCLYAQIQLLLSDYVQHYGLRRGISGPRVEPVGPQHAWDGPHAFSGLMMVNAPRHSDHHISPTRPYPGLRLSADGRPMLPYALPVMAVLALIPPVWRRVMDGRVARMRDYAVLSRS